MRLYEDRCKMFIVDDMALADIENERMHQDVTQAYELWHDRGYTLHQMLNMGFDLHRACLGI